jgi:hypothetical protein
VTSDKKSDDEEVSRANNAERRRYERTKVETPGRVFVPGDGREVSCMVLNLSPGGASIQCDDTLPDGVPVVLYVDSVGRFEGIVTWIKEADHGISFHSSPQKQARTADRLKSLGHGIAREETALRRHERFTANDRGEFQRADGTAVPCIVLDLSTSGASLKTTFRPAIGEVISLGATTARVVRYHEDGIGVEFVRPANA